MKLANNNSAEFFATFSCSLHSISQRTRLWGTAESQEDFSEKNLFRLIRGGFLRLS